VEVEDNFMNEYAMTRPLYNYLRQYEWIRRVYRESRTAIHIAQNRILAIRAGDFAWRRRRNYLGTISEWKLPIQVTSADDLLAQCDGSGIRCATGRHSVYLPPQPMLRHWLGEIVEAFPEDAGFKILRNFESPMEASYLSNGHQRRLTKRMMGSVTNQALAANALAALDLGPPCYGIAHLHSGCQEMTAFVVRHVQGDLATPEDCESFVQKLHSYISQQYFELVPVRGLKDPDFLPPNCNGNLLREQSTGRLQYIDFQQFLVVQRRLLQAITHDSPEDVHFGGTSKLWRRGRKYLYQSVPGLASAAKRDTNYRWRIYKAALAQCGVQLKGKVVLDVCCNTGVMLSHAIGDGAAWGIGWDLPNVLSHSRRIMQALGAGCATLVPARLSSDYQIAASIPNWLRGRLNDSVLFYLAAIQHVDIIRDLANVPWKTALFEDHEGITQQEARNNLSRIEAVWNCRLAWQGKIRDGDCGTRSIAVFQRDV
jgi:hypothetical protein